MLDENSRPTKWSLRLARLGALRIFLEAVLEKYLPAKGKGISRRERVTRAIEFTDPDRIPHQQRDFWFLFHFPPQSWQPPGDYYPYVHPAAVALRAWRWDKRDDTGWLKEDRIAVDEFGTLWKASGRTSLGETVKGPLEDGWHLLDDYRLPDMKDFSRFKRMAALSRWIEGDRYRLGVDTNSIRERFQFLRGFENAMTDVVLHPRESRRLLSMLTDMTIDIVDNFNKAGAHGFMLVDDWGTQDRPLISPLHFREFFLPCYKRVTDHCHRLDMHCGMHSCGDIKMLVPIMIEAGLDFLQLDSPNMCGLDWLAKNAAGKVCLFCSVDIQEVYPSNHVRIIDRYVREMIAKLADDEGGFVAWPYSEPWVIEVGAGTVRLERRLFKKYGRYPLDRGLLDLE